MTHAYRILLMKFEMFVLIIIKENLLSNENLIQVSCQKIMPQANKVCIIFLFQLK